MDDPIDQLTEWWENAEQGTPRMGDVIIRHNPTDGPNFIILVADEFDADGQDPECWGTRILARAPKPAWHDAVAVMARLNGAGIRHALIRDGRDRWITMYGGVYMAIELSDVTPLIEAKVTDEMVTRAHIEMMRLGLGDYSDRTLTSILTAALGIES